MPSMISLLHAWCNPTGPPVANAEAWALYTEPACVPSVPPEGLTMVGKDSHRRCLAASVPLVTACVGFLLVSGVASWAHTGVGSTRDRTFV